MQTQRKKLSEMKAQERSRRIKATEWVGSGFADMLKFGIPTMGWEGDPFLMVCWNKQLDRIEIWDTRQGEGEEQLVGSAPASPPPSPQKMIEYLMMRDTHRKSLDKIIDEIDVHNDKIIDAQEREHQDQMEEANDHVELAAHKEIFGFRARVY